jgi:prepilin-type N-terminal cleavage/methylation domain-containing protein
MNNPEIGGPHFSPRLVLRPLALRLRLEEERAGVRVFRISQHRAFTLPEVLISLALISLLLLAMTGMFSAAGSAWEMNDRYARAVQQARVAENLVMTELRRAQSIGTLSSSTINFTACPTDFSGHSITIAYNNNGASSNPNTLTFTDATTGVTSVLASNVSSALFTYNAAKTGISMDVTIQIDANSISLSDSAAPRCNLPFN